MKFKLPRYFDSDYVREVLHEYGVKDVDGFLNPTSRDLQSWKDLKNIKEGLDLIKNLSNNAIIAMVVDCDTDGFTSSAILFQYLKRVSPQFTIVYYLHDGKQHGLADLYQKINKNEYDLVIVPDAGSNDYEFIEKIKCPVLILDHHEVEPNTLISQNCVLINNQISPNYKNKNLSGAGIAYQFCRAMDDYFDLNYANDYIDLAALGVCGDMMDGREAENQYLWKIGFSNIKNIFFKMFCEKQSYSMGGKINPTTVAFYIVPYINAMIRVGTMEEKARLFEAIIDGKKLIPSNKRGAKGTMDMIANEAIRECSNAKTHQDNDKKEIAALLEKKIEQENLLNNKILFVRIDRNFPCPSTIRGLVCMQLAAKYKRPTIVATLDERGFVSGSARTFSNCALESFKDFLSESKMFEFTQGHQGAFGLSIVNDKLESFHEYANKKLSGINFNEGFYTPMFYRHGYDNDIPDIIREIAKYDSIWSQQCEQPKILIDKLHLKTNEFSVMGKNQDTIKFKYNGIEYIKFFAKDLIEELKQHQNMNISVYGKMGLNEFRGNVTPQIIIDAIEIEEDNLFEF